MTQHLSPNIRRELLANTFQRVEQSVRRADSPLGHGYSPDDQIIIPYSGAFTWHTHGSVRLIDANSVLFVDGQQEFEETHPVEGIGHGAVIMTLHEGGDDELSDRWRKRRSNSSHSVAAMSEEVRLLTHTIAAGQVIPLLELEHRCVQVLDAILSPVTKLKVATAGRIVERAKEFLHAHLSDELSLPEIAAQIGVAPVYLTQAFTRHEGIPLYQYLLKLRMNQALVELPGRRDITSLALDLGFSSHSHFSASFRSAFGVTPSQYRSLAS